jgi:hypothetical protein
LPNLSDDEVQELVNEARLGAITLDTNIFYQFDYNLEARTLVEMGQFPRHGIRHLVTDVVAGEVRAHMIAAEDKARSTLRGALRRYMIVRGRSTQERERVAAEAGIGDDPEVSVYARWLDFIVSTQAELLLGTAADGEVLAEMYFAHSPPFATKADKKHEFPDAIALLALEASGEAMGKHVLAISKDQGWAAFAAISKWIVIMQDPATAIGLLHAADAIAAERALALLTNDDAGVRDDIDSAIGRFVDNFYPAIEAESCMEFTAEFEGASLVGIDPVDPTSATVLASDPETVTLAFEITIDVDVGAQFSFHVHDSVDDDDLNMGGTTATRRITLTLPITMIVLRGSTEADGAVLVEVEQMRQRTVDFGFVAPDDHQGKRYVL